MKQFKITDRVQDAEFKFIEKESNVVLPTLFKEFLKRYGGMSIEENSYNSVQSGIFHVGQFLMFDEILNLAKEFIKVNNRKLVPFAYDPGGWHFCLSFDQESYGKIIINRWTDHKPEDQFLVIANSFEDFINGLKKEND